MTANGDGTKPAATDASKENQVDPATALSNCLLDQYRFCASGAGLGVAYSLSRTPKGGLVPLVVGGALGTVADLVYGYTIACVAEADRYHNSQEE